MKNILFILILLVSVKSFAQVNFVPNPGFEDSLGCPFSSAELYKTTFWQDPFGSIDYFRDCSTGFMGVPNNKVGVESAHNGVAYIGMVFFTPYINNGREYVEVKLTDSLLLNKKYYIEFYVSLADSVQFAIWNLGVYFSANGISGESLSQIISHNPQVTNTPGNFLINKNGWKKVSGIFISDGTEKYITIGNFEDDSVLDTLFVGGSLNDYYKVAYYYLDDVSVVQMPETDAGINDTICEGDSALLKGTLNDKWQGMSAYWQPQAGLAAPDSLQTMAAPAVTTTYYLHAKCDSCTEPYDSLAGTLVDSVTIYVVQPPAITTDAGKDTTINEGQSVQLGSPAQSGLTYQWQPETWLDNAYSAQPWASPAGSITYFLTAINDTNGCGFVYKDSCTVIVIADTTPAVNSLIVFNAFTPNGDGVNDVFTVKGKNIKALQGTIINRWGQELFIWCDINGGWDGKYKGKEVAEGAYFYVIRVEFLNGEMDTKTGSVALVR